MASLLVTVLPCTQYRSYLFGVLKPGQCSRHGDPAKYYCIAYTVIKNEDWLSLFSIIS